MTRSQALPRILVLYCGGTIVMTRQPDGSYGPPPDTDAAQQALLDLEPRLRQEIAHLDVELIANIDSTNIEPKHWQALVRAIEKHYDDYDGFVVTHGTDTMAYTAAALSVAICDLGKPVVLTGAQVPCSDVESDARRNFVNAVRVACLDLRGVYVVFDEEIIEGTRATKVSESRLDAFETVNARVFGEIRTDIRFNCGAPRRQAGRPEFLPDFDPRVAVVTVLPGSLPGQIRALKEAGARGIVIRGYGAGNIPDRLLTEIAEAAAAHIPVVVSTQCVEGATAMQAYAVGRAALENGALQGRDLSLEYLVVKMMWLLGRSHGVHAFREALAE